MPAAHTSLLPAVLAAVLTTLAGCAPAASGDAPVSAAPEGLWEHWGDGQGELSGYALTQPRYGQERAGQAVLVFVTEDFTRGDRVKSDGGHGDEFPVMKLNAIRDFQTGIYDYNTMTSAFVPLDGSQPLGQATKLSFSSQEWCGHVYDQLVIDRSRYRRVSHSYFDGEADRDRVVPVPEGGIFADALPVLIRGLAGELVAPGGTLEAPLHPPLLDQRLTHQVATWVDATIQRSAGTTSAEVPAGTFEVETWTVRAAGLSTTWQVEAAAPRRIVAWSRSDGAGGQLTGSLRTPYWRKHSEGDEALLSALFPGG